MRPAPPPVICVRLSIHGQVGRDSFADWICHRARLLNLTGSVRVASPYLVEVIARGDPVLVDAMEIACSLGPADVLVERIETLLHDTPASSNGFARLPEHMPQKPAP